MSNHISPSESQTHVPRTELPFLPSIHQFPPNQNGFSSPSPSPSQPQNINFRFYELDSILFSTISPPSLNPNASQPLPLPPPPCRLKIIVRSNPPPPPTSVPTKRASWSDEDIELLLEWFGSDLSHMELYKTKPKDAHEKIARDVFDGRRTPNSIKSKWESLKEKHREARAKLESTGEGEFNLQELQEDEEKWVSIQEKWLRKLCPYFEELEDILQRDKSYTPHYVSETSGTTHLQLYNNGRDSSQVNDTQLTTSTQVDDTDNDDDDDDHPPTGGQKNSLKRGQSSGKGGSTGLKKRKTSNSGEELVREQQAARLKLDTARFGYERERDAADRELLKKREGSRHEESLVKLNLLTRKIELEFEKLRAKP